MCKIRTMGFEQKQLLQNINIVSFVLVDLTLYLDTHPFDKQAMAYFNHYSKIRGELLSNYAMKYGPLTLSTANNNCNEWEWALQPPPWEGGSC